MSEFDLVCDRSWFISASKSIYQFGYLVSSILFGMISDRWGRRFAYRSAICLELVASLSQAVSFNIQHFMVSRFFLGLGAYARFLSGMIVLLEWAGPKKRAQIKMILEVGWCGGYTILPVIFYFIRHFRYMQLIVFFYELSFIYWLWITPESPSWLILNGRYGEAAKSLTDAAVRNQKGTSVDVIRKLEILRKSIISEENVRIQESKKTIIDLWKSKVMLKYSLSLYFIWFSVSFVSYGFAYNASDIGGSVYVTFFFMGLLDVINNFLMYFIINRFNRKSLSLFFTFCGSISVFLMVPFTLVEWGTPYRMIFAVFGKFFLNGTFHMIYLQSAEIFPTGLRQIGVGSCSVSARIGSILAPFVRELNRMTHISVSITIFGLVSTISGFLFLLLPETRNKPIPNTIREAEGRDHRKSYTHPTDVDYNNGDVVLTKKIFVTESDIMTPN